MTPKPQQKGCWPKEIVVCLGCGDALEVLCTGDDDGSHGPTQTVPVLPLGVAEEIADKLERAMRVLGSDSLHAECERALRAYRQMLEKSSPRRGAGGCKEVIERLRADAEGARGVADGNAEVLRTADNLEAAAELLEAGEGRVEYRVAFDCDGAAYCTATVLDNLPEAEEWAANRRDCPEKYTNVRVISRTVTETPWTDLEEAQQ